MRAIRRAALARLLLVATPSLAAATAVVAFLQDELGVPNPSAVYLVAVVATAIVSGTVGAIGTAIGSFVLYNYLFTDPRYTLSISDPAVWLSAILLLFTGVVVGQLTALQRSRADLAAAREREVRALFAISRTLATRDSIDKVLGELAEHLEKQAHLGRVRIVLGTGDSATRTPPGVVNHLRRPDGDRPAEWVRVHSPGTRTDRPTADRATDDETYRVQIEAGGASVGSIVAQRPRAEGPPDADATRLLASAADQLGQAIAHDRMAAESQAAEIARQSDALKSALLQSVSHDLRTPLATIRAAAGTLQPESGVDATAQRESVEAIEREVEYLNRLVSNLLDLSRIEAGALRAEMDSFELDDLVRSTLDRFGPRLADWRVENTVGTEVVRADPIFFDAALTNVLENATRHTRAGTTIRIASRALDDSTVRVTIEDSGQGVPDEAAKRLFDKFYRVPGSRPTRSGTGIGLTVARGMVEAMGGTIAARRSQLGGLAIDIDLRATRLPDDLAMATAR